ncbi:hypothetical protein Tco_1248957, partial [Tanacetum coccineum]
PHGLPAVTGSTTGPPVNGGQRRQSTVANDGQRRRTTVGAPPDHRSTVVANWVMGRVRSGLGPGHGPGRVGSSMCHATWHHVSTDVAADVAWRGL